jgi:hypothetical protein
MPILSKKGVIDLRKTRKWIVGFVFVLATIAAAGYTYHAVNAQSGGSSNDSGVTGDGHHHP